MPVELVSSTATHGAGAANGNADALSRAATDCIIIITTEHVRPMGIVILFTWFIVLETIDNWFWCVCFKTTLVFRFSFDSSSYLPVW